MNISAPWLQKFFIDSFKEKSKFPTALLIAGDQNIGKIELANAFAQRLLCQNLAGDKDCSSCSSCHLLENGNHPDYHLITNEYSMRDCSDSFLRAATRYQLGTEKERSKRKTPKKTIVVEQIRELVVNLSVSAHYGAEKVVIIYPAEDLNINASNAMLKTLEEPTLKTYFLILIKESYLLPATIRSRCVKLTVPKPSREISLEWLRKQIKIERSEAKVLLGLAEDSPFRALDIYNNGSITILKTLPHDIFLIIENQISLGSIVEKWKNNQARVILKWLQMEIINAFRAAVGLNSSETGQLLYNEIGLIKCLEIYRKVGTFLSWPVNATDEKLFLEGTIIDLMKVRLVNQNEP